MKQQLLHLPTLLLLTLAAPAAWAQSTSPPPNLPNENREQNWTQERTFDGEGREVSASKQFVDGLGRPTQAQARNAATKQVFATQTVYNTGGQPVLQTLAAPINNQSFSYKEGFITAGQAPYGPVHFEGPKANAPVPVDARSPGTLGYYFSELNAQEPLTPITSYPYSLVEPDEGPLGGTRRAAGPGDELRMGKGREAKGRDFPLRQEFDDYLRLRPQFVPGSPLTSLEYQGLKSVSLNADGRESIVVTNKEGQVLIRCLSGPQYAALTVAGAISADGTDPSAPVYQDIHIPAAGVQDVTLTMSASYVKGGRVRIVNLLTSDTISYALKPASSGAGSERHVSLAPGFYRLVSVTGTQRASYAARYGNFSYTYYNDAGQVVATVAPNSLPGSNLLRNPGFEQEVPGNPTINAWESSTQGVAYTQGGASVPAHGGLYYGVHWAARGHDVYTSQKVTGLPNGLYTARAWVKNTGVQVGTLRVQEYDATGTQRQATIPVTGVTGAWQPVEILNISVQNGQCRVGFASLSPKDNWILFDDVELVRQVEGSAPAFVTRNTYDTRGRLLATESNDEGRSEYVYAQDGRIRFSQSALQRPTGRYSYSNYDDAGRVVESGEFTPAATGTAGAEFEGYGSYAAKRVGESLLLEAESAAFADNLANQAYKLGVASNGYEVAFLQAVNNFVEFSAPLASDQGGRAELQLRYSNGLGNARTMTLSVNGGAGQTLTFPPTAGWDVFATLRLSVVLRGGTTNKILLKYGPTDNGNVNVDYLRVTPFLVQEAEEAAFVNAYDSKPTDVANASGGREVAYLSAVGNYVEFNLTPEVGQNGVYELQLGYANGSGEARKMTLSVNGQRIRQLSFLPTGGWETFSTLYTTATLQAGVANKVRLTYTSSDNGSVNLDYLRAVAPFRQEAENASFTNNYANQPNDIPTASGGQDVGNLTSIGTNVRFTLPASRAGTYPLTLRYATGSATTKTMSLVVNDALVRQLALPGTGGWTQFATYTFTAELRAGSNSVQLLYGPNDTGYVDPDYLQADGLLVPLAHDQSVHDLVEDRTRTGGLVAGKCTQRNQVWYDLPWDGTTLKVDGTADPAYKDQQLTGRTQEFVLGAVTKTQNDNVTTWYSYDELGRVTWVVQDIKGVGVKTLDYTYDFSGNVLEVAYQKGQPDSFYHTYGYDAAQRLTTVYTSPDGTAQTLQAEYSYYLHGPLKRVQVAGDLQGVDYTYTLQGALKAINHVNQTLEPGHDSPERNGVQKDLFALTLDYFSGDYRSKAIDVPSLLTGGPTAPTRYDGTIQGATWRTAASTDLHRVAYTYDEKSQLQDSQYGQWQRPKNSSNYLLNSASTSALREGGMSYDANGNIQSLQRTDQTGATTDNFSYSYKPNTNQLASVHTGSQSGATVLDYDYDELGQMIRQRDGQDQRYFTYDITGKTTGVYLNVDLTHPLVEYAYDDRGFRVRQTVYPATGGPAHVTTYVRDVAGNLMALYEQENSTSPAVRSEVPLYGSGRLGTLAHLSNSTDDYRYELTDHLGAARVVFHRPTTETLVETMEMTKDVPTKARFQNDDLYRVPIKPGVNGEFAAKLDDSQLPGQELKRVLKVTKGDTITFSALGLWQPNAPRGTDAGMPYLLLGLGAGANTFSQRGVDGQLQAPTTGPRAWLTGLAAGLGFALGQQSTPRTLGSTSLQGWIRYRVFDAQGNEIINNDKVSVDYLFGSGKWEYLQTGVRVEQDGTVEVIAGTSGTGEGIYFDNLRVEQMGGLIVQEQHQYAYGAPLPGLSYTVGNRRYRYGYQGKFAEYDSLTGFESFEARLYNSRVGRWNSPDAVKSYSTPYFGMGNNPISYSDPDGRDIFILDIAKTSNAQIKIDYALKVFYNTSRGKKALSEFMNNPNKNLYITLATTSPESDAEARTYHLPSARANSNYMFYSKGRNFNMSDPEKKMFEPFDGLMLQNSGAENSFISVSNSQSYDKFSLTMSLAHEIIAHVANGENKRGDSRKQHTDPMIWGAYDVGLIGAAPNSVARSVSNEIAKVLALKNLGALLKNTPNIGRLIPPTPLPALRDPKWIEDSLR